jgi:hypothetical protein
VGLFGRWHKGDALIDTLIVPPRVRYDRADETLPVKMKTRREAAERIRQRASAVETGAAVSKVLTMAKRSEGGR